MNIQNQISLFITSMALCMLAPGAALAKGTGEPGFVTLEESGLSCGPAIKPAQVLVVDNDGREYEAGDPETQKKANVVFTKFTLKALITIKTENTTKMQRVVLTLALLFLIYFQERKVKPVCTQDKHLKCMGLCVSFTTVLKLQWYIHWAVQTFVLFLLKEEERVMQISKVLNFRVDMHAC